MLFVEEGELEAFDDEKILYNIPQGSLLGVTSVMDGAPYPAMSAPADRLPLSKSANRKWRKC